MALTDSLVAWYSMEEDFAQAISAVNSVPPNAMPLFTVNNPSGSAGNIFTRSVPGKIGQAAGGWQGVVSAHLEAPEHAIAKLDRSKTFAFWIRKTAFKQEGFTLGKVSALGAAEYAFGFDGTSKFFLASQTQQIVWPILPAEQTWYFVMFWYDQSANKAYLKIDNEIPMSATFTVALQPGAVFSAAIGAVELDELAIWDRILDEAEQSALYNLGAGVTYADLIQQVAPRACRSLECCDENPAAYVSAAGEGTGYNSACEPLPQVIFEPTSGTRLIMPSLVTLRSDNEDAVIHYTTDGSTPTSNSPVYSSAITISAPAQVIRAVAIVEGCPNGPEAAAQYQQFTPAAHFTYACTTTDKSGQWGAFAADGNADYNWQVQIQFTAITGVKEFTVQQLFPDGTFTGSLWGTKEFPLAEYPLNRAFPLVIWKGGVQQNVAYLDDYSATVGTFAIGAHTLDLYGSPWTSLPSSHLFKLRMVFADGSTVERLVDSTCDGVPGALCPVPSITSLTPQCGPPLRIDVTYSLGIGTSRKIFRSTSPSGPFTEIASGAVAASPETFQDNTVVAGQTYYYYIANIPAGCVAYINSIVTPATAIPAAEVEITASPLIINSGASSTVVWNSANNSGTVQIDPTIGVQPGNVPGSQVVSPLVTTTYTILGQNVCGDDALDQVTVTVIPPATCAIGAQPDLVRIVGYSSSFFGSGGCDFRTGGFVAWNGTFANQPLGECSFLPAPGPGGTPAYHFGSDVVPNREMNVTETKITQGGGLWTLSIVGYDPGGSNVIAWRGTKATGSTPIGTYNRTTGCSSLPTSLTVEQV